MLIEISNYDLSGDLKASKLYLVKYYNQNEPENSGFSLTMANDNEHLKEIERSKLKDLFEKGEWLSVESENFETFEEHFENDWNNWIKYFEIGNSHKLN